MSNPDKLSFLNGTQRHWIGLLVPDGHCGRLHGQFCCVRRQKASRTGNIAAHTSCRNVDPPPAPPLHLRLPLERHGKTCCGFGSARRRSRDTHPACKSLVLDPGHSPRTTEPTRLQNPEGPRRASDQTGCNSGREWARKNRMHQCFPLIRLLILLSHFLSHTLTQKQPRFFFFFSFFFTFTVAFSVGVQEGGKKKRRWRKGEHQFHSLLPVKRGL